jgi:DNA-directed RNA polymerase subunit RPC12/RpoP
MPLIKCLDCAKEFSDLSENCPNCGRPHVIKKPKRTKRKILLLLVLVYIIWTIFSYSQKAKQRGVSIEQLVEEHDQQKTAETIKASVRRTRDLVVVTNNNDFDWDSVRLWLNEDGGYGTSYDQKVKAGSTIEADADEFTNRGKRFNPALESIDEIFIEVPGHRTIAAQFR